MEVHTEVSPESEEACPSPTAVVSHPSGRPDGQEELQLNENTDEWGKIHLNFKSVQLKQRINISGILLKTKFTHGLVSFPWYHCHEKYPGWNSDLTQRDFCPYSCRVLTI